MARYLNGDPVVITAEFKVGDTLTDPTTVALAVTTPSGTTTTYTYAAATVTKDSPGTYSKNLTANEAGTWTYVWTGTGAAADKQDGSFTVDDTSTSILTITEARAAVPNFDNYSTQDERLARMNATVSARIDELCGPVVNRTITGEVVDLTGSPRVTLRYAPVFSITTINEYSGTTPQLLAVENFPSATTAYDYRLVDSGRWGTIERRSSGYPTGFVGERLIVTYVAGRGTVGTIPAKFKEAAAEALYRLWDQYAGAWSRGTNPFGEQVPTLGFYKAIDPVVEQILGGELDVRAWVA